MKKVDGNEVGIWDGFIYILWGDVGKTICLCASGDETDQFISLNDCLKEVGYERDKGEHNTVLVIFDDATDGRVFRYANYEDDAWYEYGSTEGYA